MGLEEEAERMYRGEGQRFHSYQERDVPANQLFHNLELLIERRTIQWDKLSFEERVKLELEISDYLRGLASMFRQLGVKFPKLPGFNAEQMNDTYQRMLLSGEIVETRKVVERLEWAKDNALMLREAYWALLYDDKRFDPDIVTEVLNSEGPGTKKAIMEAIQKQGGITSSAAKLYLAEQTQKLGEPVSGLIKSQTGNSDSRALTVRPDRTALVQYARDYHTLEVYFKALFRMTKIEKERLSELESALAEYGGPIKPAEREKFKLFMNGGLPGKSLGDYTLYLDFARFLGEMSLRHGQSKRRR